MNTILDSPFAFQRWEEEKDHIIWLPLEFSEWEGQKSVYITGSRGTGKTTLLQGLVYSQRLKNESIKWQLGERDCFEKKYIGIYLSMPDYVTSQFKNWPLKIEGKTNEQWEEECARIFSLYLEFGILELFIKAIQDLRIKKHLNFSPNDEIEKVKCILQEREEINNFFSEQTRSITLSDLRFFFKKMHENIRTCAINNIELTPKEIYPPLQMGQYLEEIVSILIDLCSINTNNPTVESDDFARWSLKICVDQAESLEYYQQKAINTIVARKNTDISFAIAALEGFIDIRSTYTPRHPLIDADRAYINLDEDYSDNEKQVIFFTAVANLRIRKKIGIEKGLDLKKFLGTYSLNYLLDPILKKSENELIKNIISESEKLLPFYRSANKGDSPPLIDDEDFVETEEELSEETAIAQNIPPYIQWYIFKKLNSNIELAGSEVEIVKKLKTGTLRKMRPAGLVCLCKEFDLKLPFAGYSMVIRLSDGCIRDFLKIMHEIYLLENVPLDLFISNTISIETQNKAIYQASEKKIKSIIREINDYFIEVTNLIDALGKLTSLLQSAYKERTTLVHPEKGRFEIDFRKTFEVDKRIEINDVINRAREIFCIKQIKSNSSTHIQNKSIIFRVHRLFAPHYGFSYRGAYEEYELSIENLYSLCKEDDDRVKEKIIDQIFKGIVKFQRDRKITEWV